MSKSNKDLNALGYKSKIPDFPDKHILEKVNNPKIRIVGMRHGHGSGANG